MPTQILGGMLAYQKTKLSEINDAIIMLIIAIGDLRDWNSLSLTKKIYKWSIDQQ